MAFRLFPCPCSCPHWGGGTVYQGCSPRTLLPRPEATPVQPSCTWTPGTASHPALPASHPTLPAFSEQPSCDSCTGTYHELNKFWHRRAGQRGEQTRQAEPLKGGPWARLDLLEVLGMTGGAAAEARTPQAAGLSQVGAERDATPSPEPPASPRRQAGALESRGSRGNAPNGELWTGHLSLGTRLVCQNDFSLFN